MPESDKQDILEPLFRDVTPYIGYRCLAALGRHRRVNVLNLNWDQALTQACEELNVRHVCFDLSDVRGRRSVDSFGDEPGVVAVHVHGRLGDECRFEALRTLKFSNRETTFLRKNFLSHTMVVAGASILFDTDLQALFLEEKSASSKWFFGRPDKSSAGEAVRRSLLSVLSYFTAEDIDFDELMLRILAPVLNADWDRVRIHQSALGLPALDELVWPQPKLLRPLLSKQIVALLGPARLGKTVAAHFLAYLRALWNATEPWSLTDLPVRAVDGPADAVAALSGIFPHERRAYVIDNPFGSGAQTEANLPFIAGLERVNQHAGTQSAIIIANRISSWPRVGRDHVLETMVGTSGTAPEDWFSDHSLQAYARRIAPGRQDLIEKIGAHEIISPARLIDAIKGKTFGASKLPHEQAEIADKLDLLRQSADIAWLCVILRLQEFCSEMLPVLSVEMWLGRRLSELRLHRVVSHRFQFEGLDRLRLRHDTDREATDVYIREYETNILRRIVLGPNGGKPLRDAFAAWKMIAAASAGDLVPAQRAPKITLRQCASDLLRASANKESALKLIASLDYDPWEIKDLSYEVVRLWDRIGSFDEGRVILDNILSNRRSFGAYAVLEACLYLQSSAPEEIWHKVYASLGDLVADPAADKELAIAVDALTWRSPPERYGLPFWAKKYLESFLPADGSWGLIRFLAGYHSGGLERLGANDLVKADSTCGWTAEHADFAAWLVRWHFTDQSHARAKFARQPWVDKDFLCRSLHEQPRHDTHGSMNRLLQSFLKFPDCAGWGFFLGCNIAAVGHGIDDEARKLTRDALRRSTDSSVGVIAAVLTYGTATEYAADLKSYFERDENRQTLLDGMRDGLVVDDIRLCPPRFLVNRDPISCHSDIGLNWGNLKEALVDENLVTKEGRLDLLGLVVNLRARMENVSPQQRKHALEVIRRAELGDLRLLDAAAAARPRRSRQNKASPIRNRYLQLLNRAASLLSAEEMFLL